MPGKVEEASLLDLDGGVVPDGEGWLATDDSSDEDGEGEGEADPAQGPEQLQR